MTDPSASCYQFINIFQNLKYSKNHSIFNLVIFLRLFRDSFAASFYLTASVAASPALAQTPSPVIIIPSSAPALIIKPDGTTATLVSAPAGAKPKVAIAPANTSGVSHNRYEQFNVPRTGVDLDNAISRARLIVNEVTGSAPSQMNGALSVLGPRAHVILANPNGISVDGGSFVNIGGAVLATGRVEGFSAGARVSTTTGRIVVMGEGLSTDGGRLDIIGKDISVEARIDAGAGGVFFSAGDSVHQFNASAPMDSAAGFVQRTAGSARSRNSAAIDVSNPATINGGSIRIHVTDAGAGVRLAGSSSAGPGGFSIMANGQIQINDAAIRADGAISITGAAVTVASDRARASMVSTQSGVLLRSTSGNVAVAGADIKGVARDASSFAPLGSVALDAAGDILIRASATGSRVALAASGDGIALTAKGALSADDMSLTSAGTAIVSAGGRLQFSSVDGVSSALSFLSSSAISLIGVDLVAENGVKLQGASIAFSSLPGRQGILRSTNAGVTAVTLSGDITNDGLRIKGQSKTQGDFDSQGGVTLVSSGDILNRSLDATRIGEIRAEADNLVLSALGAVHNASGNIASNADLSITAGTSILNETSLAGVLSAIQTKKTALGGLLSGTRVVLDYGAPLAGDVRGTFSAAGSLSLSAINIANAGGVIHGDSVIADARETLTSRSILTGQGTYSRSCFFFCSTKGNFNINTIEARISASDKLRINAAIQVETSGAQLVAANDVDINSPRFAALSLLTPMIALRPSGFAGVFRGQDGWFGYGYNGGLVASFYASFSVAASEISIEGVSINAAKSVKYGAPPKIQSVPQGAGPAFNHAVGLLSGVLR